MTKNALTVDVEDYFQVSALAPHIDRGSWDSRPCRVERNVQRLLALFDEAGAQATFFTLGWVADRYPQLVREIVAQGHELASHGYAHRRASEQTRQEFSSDVLSAKHLLEDVSGQPVRGYRALTRATARAALTYRFNLLLGLGAVLVQLVALLAVWRVILAESPVNGFTWPQMRAYLLVAFAAGTVVSILGDSSVANRLCLSRIAAT